MTLRKGKEVDNKVEMPVKKIAQVVPLESEDPLINEKEDSSPREYIPKAHFP